jgi:hypothetical protein
MDVRKIIDGDIRKVHLKLDHSFGKRRRGKLNKAWP